MKAQEILSKIKEVVGIELSEEVSVQLEEIKLDNGTILVAEKFESGQSVFIKSEDDENIALPVGEYALEDGRKLMVKEEGLIDAIGEVEVKEEEEVEASEETATEEEKVEETELEEEEVAMEYVTKEEFSKAVEEIKGMIENMSKEEMKEEVEKEELSAEVAEPVVHNPEAKSETKSFFNKSYPNTIQNRIYQKLNQ